MRRRVAVRFGLSESDIETLEELIDMGAATAGKLSEVTGLTSGAVTRVIDRLEQAGYVRRVPDPDDRRAKRISLTDAGHAAVRAAEPAREQFIVDLLGALASEERDQLVMLIDKLNARLLEMDADS